MMATTAVHCIGDVSRKEPSICCIIEEDAENYYGAFVIGYGLIDVKFPKVTTRELTREEQKRWDGACISVNGHPHYTIDLSAQ
jgi:hypothetical protein